MLCHWLALCHKKLWGTGTVTIWNKAQNLKKSVIIGCYDGRKVDNVGGHLITTKQTRAYENH